MSFSPYPINRSVGVVVIYWVQGSSTGKGSTEGGLGLARYGDENVILYSSKVVDGRKSSRVGNASIRPSLGL